MRPGFRILDHTADTGIAISGGTLAELFANAARGLFAVITDLRSIREAESREISARGHDPESLLVAWLNEFVYRFDSENLLFRRFEIDSLTSVSIKARAFGERVDPRRHDLRTGIKSATYHALAIRKTKDGYRARVIFDV